MKYKDFEQYGLAPEDFKIDAIVIKPKLSSNNYIKGVEITIPSFEISVKSWSEKTLKANENRCFEMLNTLLNDAINNTSKANTEDIKKSVCKSSNRHKELFKKLAGE